jgi:predicted esterase
MVRAYAALVTGFTAGAMGQGGMLDVGPAPAVRAVVTRAETPPPPEAEGSVMLGALHGVLADMRGKELAAFRAAVPANPLLGDPTGGERVGVVHLYGRAGQTRRVDLVRSRDGGYVAVSMEGGPLTRAELNKEAALEAMSTWLQYQGGFGPSACTDPRGEVVELPRPYVPGRFTMDLPTLSKRFLRGRPTDVNPATRDLSTEKLWVRLPNGYDPRRPAGLLVWIDARMGGGGGEPPAAFNDALDNLGIICVGAANSGNDRYAVDRYQLALDATATACRRYHVDSRRVYVAGISGGGRVASILVGCFPDVFTGAVPIVGMDTYQNVPTGTGSFVPAGFLRPPDGLLRLLKQRPIAPITGPHDVNYNVILSAAYLMQRDGLRVRVFEYADMGHEMPAPTRFRESLAWIDGVYQGIRRQEEQAAAKTMETYDTRWKGESTTDEAGRRLLVRATAEGPWTEPAWRAAGLLGVSAP